MAKDPALLFYTSDFLTGVSDLTMEERGQLITLLCLHHQKGRLTQKVIDISVPNVSEDVMAKFSKDENDLYFNTRLEYEADKRRKHSKRQSQNAKSRWDKEKAKKNAMVDAMANATALPLENENENRNDNEKSLLRENNKTNKNEIINEEKPTDKLNDTDREELLEKFKSERVYKSDHNNWNSQDSSFIEV